MNVEFKVGDSINIKDLFNQPIINYIYQLRHKPTGKIYIGMTNSIVNRMKSHFQGHEDGYPHDPNSQCPISKVRKNGRKYWELTVVEAVLNREIASSLEKQHIKQAIKKYGRKKILNHRVEGNSVKSHEYRYLK